MYIFLSRNENCLTQVIKDPISLAQSVKLPFTIPWLTCSCENITSHPLITFTHTAHSFHLSK